MSAAAPTELRIAIADDEPLARARLQRHVARIPHTKVVAECADGDALLEALGAHDVDLLLLDVQMPGLSGFDALERVPPDRRPLVVFVTAHDRFAVRAFEVHAFDYLLKPVRPERLREAVDRAREASRGSHADDAILAQLRELRRDLGARGEYLERLAVTVGKRSVILPVDEIDWIDAADNYARFHQQGKSYLHRISLGELEKQLDPRRFVRIHRSAIVNVDRIRDIVYTPSGDGTATLQDGTTVKLSRSYRTRLAALIR
jgi:two-component system, LytTR family, response regulator